MASEAPPRGAITTFYSYKGGTGRTMALANVACLLAETSGRQVLVVDWDLEAPGLHRFFPPRFRPSGPGIDLGLDDTPGLIDLFSTLRDALPGAPPTSEEEADAAVSRAFEAIRLDDYIRDTNVPNVRILRAGRNDDGEYSRRVGTFDWEGLFTRVPGIYRALGERLASQYAHVLVDSRTGVTDISGICTYLLPERLVVVFTPNRQSLTGVRELVERATTYRRNSDDLRPLLVYPLPSRIEASLQDLRARWRFGDPDRDVIGYQPMFQDLLATSYGLPECNLETYFDEVQIQQTPDYAYGEEIAVRRTGDRFSMANSYAVFVRRLTSAEPPWGTRAGEAQSATPAPVEALTQEIAPTQAWTTDQWRDAMTLQRELKVPNPAQFKPKTPKPPPAGPSAPKARPQVFLSYASEDRERVQRVARRLEERDFRVWTVAAIPPGSSWTDAVGKALDESRVVVVFWSRAALESRSVATEAEEGLRRSILVPVLLDDVAPPLAFRSIQSADLRRETDAAVEELADAVERVAMATPGTVLTPGPVLPSPSLAPAPSPPAPRREVASGRPLRLAFAAAVVVVAFGLWGIWGLVSNRTQPGDSTQPSTGDVTVPNFVGASSTDANRTAQLLGLTLVMSDGQGATSAFLDGVVTSQSPAASSSVARLATIQLRVATQTVAVPTLVGTTLNTALAGLERSGLRLGATTSQQVADAKPGTIVGQKPDAGQAVPAGTTVDVVVATAPPAAAPSTPSPQGERRPPGRGEGR
jgi:cellulose biosynthesis protein BcsQ